MRSPRRPRAALAFAVLLSVLRYTYGVSSQTNSFQSRFRTDLGKEWQVHLDAETGRPYYFDKETGTTTWDDPRDEIGEDSSESSSTKSSFLGRLFTPGEVKFTGGGFGGRSRASSKRAARDGGDGGDGFFGWGRSGTKYNDDGVGIDDDYVSVDFDQRKSSGGWSTGKPTRRRSVGGTTESSNNGVRAVSQGLNLADDFSESEPQSQESLAYAEGSVFTLFLCGICGGVLFGFSVLKRVSERTGAGSVGYSTNDATFLGEVFRETLTVTRKGFNKFNMQWLTCQLVLVEVVESAVAFDVQNALKVILTAIQVFDGSQTLTGIAQILIIAYHLTCCAEKFGAYFLAKTHALAGNKTFPFLAFKVNVACALVLHDVHRKTCLLFLMSKSGLDVLLMFVGGASAFSDGVLGVKKLAAVSCTLLLVAHTYKSEETKQRVRRGNSIGAIVEDEHSINQYPASARHSNQSVSKQLGRAYSAVLLSARILVAAVFCYSAQWVYSHDQYSDDRICFLLHISQLLFAVPLAAGFKSGVTARALAVLVSLEAFWVFDFWSSEHFHRNQTTLHFAANSALVGGLLLMRTGGGRYAADAYRSIPRKRE